MVEVAPVQKQPSMLGLVLWVPILSPDLSPVILHEFITFWRSKEAFFLIFYLAIFHSQLKDRSELTSTSSVEADVLDSLQLLCNFTSIEVVIGVKKREYVTIFLPPYTFESKPSSTDNNEFRKDINLWNLLT